MKVLVQYTAQLRAAFGTAEEEVEPGADGLSLAALIAYLALFRCPDAAPHLLDDAGDTQPSLLIAVNKKAVPAREAHNFVLQPNDVITLMPPIAGG